MFELVDPVTYPSLFGVSEIDDADTAVMKPACVTSTPAVVCVVSACEIAAVRTVTVLPLRTLF